MFKCTTFKIFIIYKATSRGETTGANGSVPRGQRHSEVEEDTFIGGVSSNVSSHASRLDITMMDRPETASTRLDCSGLI